MKIAETVSQNHPDKICDRISDAILDECLRQDPMSRVAVETMGGHGIITVTGEVTTKAFFDAREIVERIMGKPYGVQINIVKQSPNISQGVDKGGAGDQGVMIGYACRDNDQYIPQELYLARQVLKPYHTDAKSQVVLEDNGEISNIVLSVQGSRKAELEMDLKTRYPGVKYYCNNTGSFEIGGFDADSGVTGRKIVVDAYGPRVPVGGGAFSGKDPTKVDRSAAYMARWIALKELKDRDCEYVLVKLGYVIGREQPVIKLINVSYNNDEYYAIDNFKYDCRPEAIIERFDLRRPIYEKTAEQGHFGFIGEYPWETV